MHAGLRITIAGTAFIALLTGFSDAGGAWNTTEADVTSVDLSQAIRLARDQNLDLERAANQMRLGEAVVERERAAFLPDLRLSMGPSMRFHRLSEDHAAAGLSGRTTTFNTALSSSLNLFSGFAQTAALAQARMQSEAYRSHYAWSVQTTAYLIATHFFQLELLRELEQVYMENLDAQRTQLERIQALYEAGSRSRSDRLQQETEIASAEQALIALRRDLELRELRLKQLLRLDPERSVAFQPLPRTFVEDLTAMALEESATLTRQALALRPDVDAVDHRLNAAGEAIRVARSGHYPTISLSASVDSGYRSTASSGFSAQLADENPSSTVGVALTVPIFDRRRTRTNVAQAEIGLHNERLNAAALVQQVGFAIEEALLDIRTAEAQHRSARAQLDTAEEALAAMEARYEVGASTLFEVIQSRARRTEAAARLAEAHYRLLGNKLALAYETGTIPTLLESV